MDPQRVRNANFICQKWTLFSITLMMLIGSIILAVMSKKIADSYYEAAIYQSDSNGSLRNAIIALSVTSGLFSLFGLMGAFKEHYCSTVTFAIYMTLNTIGILYIAIQSPGLWVYAIVDLCITVLTFSFAKLLRRERLLRVMPTFIITGQRNQTFAGLHVNSLNAGQQIVSGPANQQWQLTQQPKQWQPQQPPPYSH